MHIYMYIHLPFTTHRFSTLIFLISYFLYFLYFLFLDRGRPFREIHYAIRQPHLYQRGEFYFSRCKIFVSKKISILHELINEQILMVHRPRIFLTMCHYHSLSLQSLSLSLHYNVMT